MNKTTMVHFYDLKGQAIVESKEYATRALAVAACKRAAKRGKIAGIAGTRTAADPPTCHH